MARKKVVREEVVAEELSASETVANESASTETVANEVDTLPTPLGSTKKMSVNDLVSYAAQAEAIYNKNDAQQALVRFRQGKALADARLKFTGKDPDWRKLLKTKKISPTTDNRVRRLYEAAKKESALAGMTLTACYKKFLPPKATRKKTAAAKSSDATPPRPPIRKPDPRELDALTVFLAACGSWDRARDLLTVGEDFLPRREEPSV